MPPSNEKKAPGGEVPGGIDGFRFNAVTEEATRQVITPRVDPAARRRTVVILVLALIAVFLLAFVTLNPFGVETQGGAPAGKNRAFRPSTGEPGG